MPQQKHPNVSGPPLATTSSRCDPGHFISSLQFTALHGISTTRKWRGFGGVGVFRGQNDFQQKTGAKRWSPGWIQCFFSPQNKHISQMLQCMDYFTFKEECRQIFHTWHGSYGMWWFRNWLMTHTCKWCILGLYPTEGTLYLPWLLTIGDGIKYFACSPRILGVSWSKID